MEKKIKTLACVFALALASIISLPSSASAEEINLQSFRNVVTGVNTNNDVNLATNMNVQSKIGWQNIEGIWYYFKDGFKTTGWINDKGQWYYLNSFGVMLHDTVVDGYHLNSLGAWTVL